MAIDKELPTILRKLASLKERHAEAERRAERAAGARDQLKAQLKKEHGCSSADEAKALLTKLEKEEVKAVKEATEHLGKFEAKWGSKLE